MEPEIVPEATREERAAILAALAEDEPGPVGGDAWRRAALQLEDDYD